MADLTRKSSGEAYRVVTFPFKSDPTRLLCFDSEDLESWVVRYARDKLGFSRIKTAEDIADEPRLDGRVPHPLVKLSSAKESADRFEAEVRGVGDRALWGVFDRESASAPKVGQDFDACFTAEQMRHIGQHAKAFRVVRDYLASANLSREEQREIARVSAQLTTSELVDSQSSFMWGLARKVYRGILNFPVVGSIARFVERGRYWAAESPLNLAAAIAITSVTRIAVCYSVRLTLMYLSLTRTGAWDATSDRVRAALWKDAVTMLIGGTFQFAFARFSLMRGESSAFVWSLVSSALKFLGLGSIVDLVSALATVFPVTTVLTAVVALPTAAFAGITFGWMGALAVLSAGAGIAVYLAYGEIFKVV